MTSATIGSSGLLSASSLALDSRCFVWEPRPDITAHELALCIPMMFGGPPSYYDKLPPEAQRHWKQM